MRYCKQSSFSPQCLQGGMCVRHTPAQALGSGPSHTPLFFQGNRPEAGALQPRFLPCSHLGPSLEEPMLSVFEKASLPPSGTDPEAGMT